MAEYKRRSKIEAVQSPVDCTTGAGNKVQKGDWIVVEDGEERILSDEDFKKEFEPDKPAKHALARTSRGGIAERPRRSKGGEIGVVSSMKGLIKNVFSKKQELPAILNEETGELSPPMTFEKGDPTVKNVRIDKHGNVISADIEPDGWPPRNEKF